MGKRAVAAVLAVGASLIAAAGAQANTSTLGSHFQGPFINGVFDGGEGTIVNTSLPSPSIAGAPSDGTLVQWRFSGNASSWVPQAVRPLGGGTYTEVGRGSAQQGTGVGNIVGPFALSIPVNRGDLIGIIGQNNARLGVTINKPGAINGYFVPPLAPGVGRTPDFGPFDGSEFAVSATLRYCLVPNLRGKKPKKAKKALKAADCTVGTKRKSKKRRKKKKVVGQSVPAGTSISDTAPVNFKVSRRLR